MMMHGKCKVNVFLQRRPAGRRTSRTLLPGRSEGSDDPLLLLLPMKHDIPHESEMFQFSNPSRIEIVGPIQPTLSLDPRAELRMLPIRAGNVAVAVLGPILHEILVPFLPRRPFGIPHESDPIQQPDLFVGHGRGLFGM